MMITVAQIQGELQEVLGGSTSLDAFDEWLARASWDMHLDSTPDAVRMASAVELRLAEVDGGFLSETDLLLEFQQILSLGTKAIQSLTNIVPQAELTAASGRSN